VNPEELLRRAREHQADGRHGAALDCLDHALGLLAPGSAQAAASLAPAPPQHAAPPPSRRAAQHATQHPARQASPDAAQHAAQHAAPHAAQRNALRAALHAERADALRAMGRHDEALESAASAARLLPANPVTQFNLGVALATVERHAEALACYDRALPALDAEGLVHAARGRSLKALRAYDAALAAFDRALERRGAGAELHLARGTVLGALQRLPDALAAYERAAALDPASALIGNARAGVLFQLGRHAEALAAYRGVLEHHPDYVPTLCNIAVTLAALRHFDEAEAGFGRALRRAPDDANTRFNLGLVRLLRGDFDGGLPLFEARWSVPLYERRRHAAIAPLAQAAQAAGRRVLLWSEQGLGDAIQYARYAPLLAARGAQVELEVDAPLVALLRTLPGAVPVHGRGTALPGFDLQAPLMSLPGLFGTRLDSVPADVPYLRADPLRVAAWRARVGAPAGRLRIGLAVSGSAHHANDVNRSIPLHRMRPLYGLADWYLLQKELRPSDEIELARSPLRDLRSELLDFGETAAAIASLDLVISVDTALVHLAGALGRPVWILLPYLPDWRWLLERSDSPWYPSARLFRAPAPGDWDAVIGELAAALRRLDPGAVAQDFAVLRCSGSQN